MPDRRRWQGTQRGHFTEKERENVVEKEREGGRGREKGRGALSLEAIPGSVSVALSFPFSFSPSFEPLSELHRCPAVASEAPVRA